MVELVHQDRLQQPARAGAPVAQAHQPSELDMLRMALNQVDYGLVVVDAETGVVQFANAIGRDALAETNGKQGSAQQDTGLCLVHGRVAARCPQDTDLLLRALARTRTGLRGLLSLGAAGQSAAVAVLPLTAPTPGGSTSAPAAALALLVFGKKQLCDDSTVALFARERGLTSTEGQVLAQVCRGLRPAEIADHHGVQISTVRTQLRSIRMKTCSETIRALVQKVSVLPPMALHLSAHRNSYA